MDKAQAIQRHESLKPLSREHHHGLLLCWKIRTGLKKEIPVDRIEKYASWFYRNNLLPHFEAEEKHIFPILGNQNELVKKALAEHRRLTRLFENKANILKSLSLIEEELEAHIRFEERILFNEIQKTATKENLEKINELHTENPVDIDWVDKFWEIQTTDNADFRN